MITIRTRPAQRAAGRAHRKASVSAAFASAMLLAACGSGGGDSGDGRVAAGQVLFDANCLSCHADSSGQRIATSGTSLVNARDNPAVIASAISANRGNMGTLSTLTSDELANIAAYIGAAIPAPPVAGPSPSPSPSPSPAPIPANPDGPNTAARAETVATGLSSPWGSAFLPDGRLLVSQRSANTFAIVNLSTGRIDATFGTGLSSVNSGQGGLLDVALDPSFAANQRVYWTFSERSTSDSSTGTAVARGRLSGNAIVEATVIFRQQPKQFSDAHFGSRLAFGNDGHLFVTMGDRRQDDPDSPTNDFAQNRANTIGKVVRITTDGAAAPGNPSFGAGSAAGLWSIGHRNPQGAAIHPSTGELWMSEHGPLGGDEINIARAGQNYGWPFRSYGCNYGTSGGSGCRIGGGTHAPTYAEPLTTWVPQSIATSNIAFNTGSRYPGWEGNLFVGAMAGIPNGGLGVWRLTLSGNSITGREYLLQSLGERVRDIAPGPDGWLYLLTDSGKLLRLRQN